MTRKFNLVLNTILKLKPSQLFWQIVYRLRSKKSIHSQKNEYSISKTIIFQKVLHQENKYLGNNKFCFLNLKKQFDQDIDWNFIEYGKLWNYNLEYFDFLFQNDVNNEEKLRLLHSFYEYSLTNKRTLEP